jgi:MucR family transcriptional regulator, transcriptional regulator of exopolysaccharide biosynthesis
MKNRGPKGAALGASPSRGTENAPIAGEANLTELTAVIVACFVSNNPISPGELPKLISNAHAALVAVDSQRIYQNRNRTPAVAIENSITHDYLICLEDGHKLRSLKRYLQRRYSLSPDDYRARWKLAADYPMVAPGYAKLRSEIARQNRLRRPTSRGARIVSKP